MLITVQPFFFASSSSAGLKVAELGVGQPARRAVGIFALRVVVQHQHHQPRAVAGAGIFQHLAVAVGVAERRVRAPADHQMNALGLAGLVVVEEQLRLLGQERLAVLVVAEFRSAHGADHLLGRDAIDPLRIDADEILAAAGDDVGLVAVVAQVLQHFEHRLIDQFGVRPVPARMLGRRQPFLQPRPRTVSTDMPVSVAARIFFQIVQRQFCDRFAVAGQHGLERLDVLQLRLLLHHRRNAIQAIDDLACRSDARPTACRPDRTWRYALRAARISGCPDRWWRARSR